MNALTSKLVEISRTPMLLVASDFDGTISPLAPLPSDARPNREAVAALHALARMPQTHVSVISGRSLRDLGSLAGFDENIHLVGSHGSEFDADFVHELKPELVQLRAMIFEQLQRIATSGDGFHVEEKPASVAFHYRQAEVGMAERALQAISDGPARDPRIQVKRGKSVVELSVIRTNKGDALASIRHRVGATAAIFLGDDESDEDAFETLRGPDVGIKVGAGSTIARFRVNDTDEAARVLASLFELRDAWLKGAEVVDIEKLSLLSDQRTAALIAPGARIVWLCVPRIDSSALFAELLGGPGGGFFDIRPADGSAPVRQYYAEDSFVLRTEWSDFHVIDFMDCSGGRPFQRAGRTDLIRSIEGSGRVVVEFAPRLDFGREPTRLRRIEDGLQIDGCLDPVVLRSPEVAWTITEDGPHHRAIAEMDLAGRTIVLELRYGVSTAKDLTISPIQRLEQTKKFWNLWAAPLRIPLVAPDLVRRSALVLKALCYGPSGAVVAAATTSLPEHVGGIRNWDYRYAWLRDSAMAATSLARLGSTGIGTRLVDWLLGIIDRDESPEFFRPVYTVTGGHLGPEAEIRELHGYRASRPVRIGNAAGQQLQLDVFGPIMELVAILAESGIALSNEHWRLTEAIVKAVSQRWHEPDHGIWEIRGPRRHHVHSRVMCWVAVDRALKMSLVYSGYEPTEWRALRDEIAHDIHENGWNDRAGAYTAYYGDSAIDAAALHVGLSGLVSGANARFRHTVEVVERVLRKGPAVYRYLYDDGLPGREGGFHLCTAWLIEALVKVGRHDDARNLFDQFAALFGPTGMAPEEYCPRTKKSLGNHPQAYTHIGLIDAALAMAGNSENTNGKKGG